MRIQRKACAHENIQDIVHMSFRESVPQGLPREVGVAAYVRLFARQELIRIWITSAADLRGKRGISKMCRDVVTELVSKMSYHIVDTGIVVVKAVGNAIVGNGRQRADVRHIAPQPIARRQVRRMDLARLAGIKVLRRILEGPAIHICYLGALVTANTPHLTRLDNPRTCVLGRNLHLLDELGLAIGYRGCQPLVKFFPALLGRNLLYRIAWDRFGLASESAAINSGCVRHG